MKSFLAGLSYFLLFLPLLCAQPDLSYYLPQDVSYNPAIPTPAEFIRHEVGEWHITHDRLVAYMEKLASVSDRISLEITGETYERRPIVLLTITTPENQGRIEEIRQAHLQHADPLESYTGNSSELPIVIWMGYSIHGDEASGSNASMLVAYYLAAAEGPAIEEKLKHSVILLDPSFNPDGLNRFASWVNMHKSVSPNPDPNDREHSMVWPAGRTNHYWFDLNRDWLPVRHPESRARVASFHRWKPNVLTDHHEMGTNYSFFFQPGVPARTNPLTPNRATELTQILAGYHAKALDKIGSLYYSEEGYDDYFYGKGSTYPDVNGGIGILFEQGSSRGHAQESENGILSFPFAIRNQFTASLSTLEGAVENRTAFLEHQRNFFEASIRNAASDSRKAFVFGEISDPVRGATLADLLRRHQIAVYHLAEPIEIEGETFSAQGSYIVPLKQAQYQLIRACFETQSEFNDSVFYDISSWTLPLAFGLPYASLKGNAFQTDLLGPPVQEAIETKGNLINASETTYAYLLEWSDYFSPRALYEIQAKGLRTKVATYSFFTEGRTFPQGTVMIPTGNQILSPAEIYEVMKEVAEKHPITLRGIATGLTSTGIDLGSRSFRTLRMPKAAVVVGRNVSSYDAGEVWHLLDQRFGIPVTLIPLDRLSGTDLNRYNTLILADGNYNSLDPAQIREWLSQGGALIGIKQALSWISNNSLASIHFDLPETSDSGTMLPYADKENRKDARTIPGTIFMADADLTHPLLYGYRQAQIPIFRKNGRIVTAPNNSYTSPLRYAHTPRISGYLHKSYEKVLGGSAALLTYRAGRGQIIAFPQNPNFRAFWYGTNKLFLNALFFSSIIE